MAKVRLPSGRTISKEVTGQTALYVVSETAGIAAQEDHMLDSVCDQLMEGTFRPGGEHAFSSEDAQYLISKVTPAVTAINKAVRPILFRYI